MPRLPEPRPSEQSERDPVLAGLGYSGDALIYHQRVARIRLLWLDGRGPGAYLDRLLAALAPADG